MSLKHRVRNQIHIPVPMRDGTCLATDLYLPEEGGPFPTLVNRVPYGRNSEPYVKDAIYFAQHGYAVVVQDVRGRWESPGSWYPFRHEPADGLATHNWVGRQPWSNGRIGTTGYSYGALTQWLAAIDGSPYLQALCPRVSFSSLYHNWAYTGGAFQLAFNARWAAVQMHSRINQYQYLWSPQELSYDRIFSHLPLITLSEVTGRACNFYEDWIRESSFGEYWKNLGYLEDKYHRVTVPALNIGGWYDVFLQGTINNFVGMREHGGSEIARQHQRLVVGPWIHSLGERGTATQTGDMDFGSEVLGDLLDEERRWFDRWLKGQGSADDAGPSVRVFVMGRNRWREGTSWPVGGTEFRELYLDANDANEEASWIDGTLTWERQAKESMAQFTYDPADPTPTVGGITCCSEDVTPVTMGPRDQMSILHRRDVLAYLTPTLTGEVEVTGPVRLKLYASSSAVDTDFCAKLVDVYPDGKVINVAEGILRARYRDSWDHPSMLIPDQMYLFDIDLWSTANCFLLGHRIGLLVSSSNFPQFDRNLNTGAPLGLEAQMKTARQHIHHQGQYASHLLLPVVR